MQKEWTKEEESFLLNNYEKMSYREIGKILERTQSSIENKAGKLGIKQEKKYKFNSSFFKSPLDEFSAYWLGFIGADGYITDDMKSLGITLMEGDSDHLKKFNKCLNGNLPVTFRIKKEGLIKGRLAKERTSCTIRIYSKSIVYDLNMLGIVPRKSLVYKFPKLENDYITWCFIRGYFDGDGSVHYDKQHNQLRCKITSGSCDFRKSFSEFLSKFNIKTYITEKGNGMDCVITGKECTRLFLSYMYDNSNIYLDRKFKKYQTYKYLFGLNK